MPTRISPEATRADLIAMIHNRDALVSALKDKISDLETELAKWQGHAYVQGLRSNDTGNPFR